MAACKGLFLCLPYHEIVRIVDDAVRTITLRPTSTLDIVVIPPRPAISRDLHGNPKTPPTPQLHLVLVDGMRYDAFLYRENVEKCIQRLREEINRSHPNGRDCGTDNTC